MPPLGALRALAAALLLAACLPQGDGRGSAQGRQARAPDAARLHAEPSQAKVEGDPPCDPASRVCL